MAMLVISSYYLYFCTKPSLSEVSLHQGSSSGTISCVPGSTQDKGQLVPGQLSQADSCANTKPSTCCAHRSCSRPSVHTATILTWRLLTSMWGWGFAVNQSICVWTSITPCGRWDSRAQSTAPPYTASEPTQALNQGAPSVCTHGWDAKNTNQALAAQVSTRTNFGSCYLQHPKYDVNLWLKT